MYRRSLLLAAGAFALPAAAAAPLPVVASFSILADIVGTIGGDQIHVASLVPPEGDAHVYQPRPSDLTKLRDAKLIVVNGLGLEKWFARLVAASGAKAPVVTASTGITPRIVDGEPDPHAWQNPRNGALYAANVAEGLTAADPASAADYRARAQKFGQDAGAIDDWTVQQFAGIAPGGRKILTSHDAFGYFGARYDIEFRGIEGIDTEAEPSAAAIAALIRQIRADRIKAVFVENMTSPKLARMVAQETGAVLGPTVYSDSLSGPKGPASTYFSMFRHNVPLFAAAMKANSV